MLRRPKINPSFVSELVSIRAFRATQLTDTLPAPASYYEQSCALLAEGEDEINGLGRGADYFKAVGSDEREYLLKYDLKSAAWLLGWR